MSLTKRYLDDLNEKHVGMCVCLKDKDNICSPCNEDCIFCQEIIEQFMNDEEAEFYASQEPDPRLIDTEEF